MSASVLTGDCLDVMSSLSSESCDLVYLDPPFFSQRVHKMVDRPRTKSYVFEDTWPSESEYRAFIFERLRGIHRVLASHGSVFFHCDKSGSRVAWDCLNEIFGEANFRAEIIWSYRRWSNSHRGLLSQHQTILWYSKSTRYVFNPLFEPYSASTNVDQLMQQRSRDRHGKTVYARDEQGELLPPDSKRGVPLGDVWDIPYLNPKANERVGYPTQKPVLLLERIIQLASEPDALVLDPFCGSGTTLVAATLLGRRSIGIDRSADAVQLAQSRLVAPKKTMSRVLEVGRAAYDSADSDAMALLSGLGAIPVHRNKGIDAVVASNVAEGNALIRVQRPREPIAIAVAALRKAAVGKRATHLVVVAVEALPSGYEPPADVFVCSAASVAIRNILSRPVPRESDGRRETQLELRVDPRASRTVS